MNTKRLLAVAVLCMIFCNVLIAGPTWVEVRDAQDNPPDIDLNTNTTDSIVVTLTIPGFYKEDSTYDDTTYQRLYFPEQTVLGDSGFPELPAVYFMVAVPECDSVFATVYAYNPHYFTNYRVFPAPNGNTETGEPVFCKNDSVYSTSAYYPATTHDCTARDYFRDQMCIAITVQPITFSPDSSKICVYDSIKVKLTFDNPSGTVNNDVGLFNYSAEEMFINYDASSSGFDNTYGPTYSWETETSIHNRYCDYLIITACPVYDDATAKAKIEELAAHRVAFNRFYVCLVKVDEIDDWDDENYGWVYIREFIRDVYDDASSPISSDHHLPFVLLVGDAWDDADTPWVPEHSVDYPLIPRTQAVPEEDEEYGSDHFYADLTYVHIPNLECEEVALGRFSVGSNAELAIIVDKTIDFETEPDPAGYEDWRYTIGCQSGHRGPVYITQRLVMSKLVNEINDCSVRDFYTYYQCGYPETIGVQADDVWQYAFAGDVPLDEWLVPLFNGDPGEHFENEPDGMLMYFYVGHGEDNDRLSYSRLL